MLILAVEVDAPDDANPIGVKDIIAQAVEHLGTVRVTKVREVLPKQATLRGFENDDKR